jgi:hypothetical protein
LNNPALNPLYELGARPLRVTSDCADVPYTLRAYFAYRYRLPFAWAREMVGAGRDPRYMSGAHPVGLHVWTEFRTPRRLIEGISSEVHSGYLRTAPNVEDSDFYQAALTPGAIRPGTVYYDPNGHVLIVYEIRPDGEVLMFDGHPGNWVTQSSLTRRHVIGTWHSGGGFKNFRPIAVRNGRVVRTPNAQIADYGGYAPFDRDARRVAGVAVPFEVYVRSRLARNSGVLGTSIMVASRRDDADVDVELSPAAAARRWPSTARAARRAFTRESSWQ